MLPLVCPAGITKGPVAGLESLTATAVPSANSFRLTWKFEFSVAGEPSLATRTPLKLFVKWFRVIVTGATKVGVLKVRIPDPRFELVNGVLLIIWSNVLFVIASGPRLLASR